MTENVDGYEITWTDTHVSITFTDLFGDGEVYTFPRTEAAVIRDGLTQAIDQMPDAPSAQLAD